MPGTARTMPSPMIANLEKLRDGPRDGALGDALAAYQEGIAVAEARGDIQAAKEMKVFAKRAEKAIAGEAG